MRNNNLDILKIVLAFLVVALHIFPVSNIDGIKGIVSYEIANGITRVAVPTFFIISGYFLRNKLNDTKYLLKYAKRIFLLFVVWQLLYLPDLLRMYHIGKFSTTDFILKLTFGYWHLWYLLATVLAVGLLFISRNCSLKMKWLPIFTLLIFGYTFQILIQSNLLKDYKTVQNIYALIGTTRDFLFFAFPAMLIGTLYDYWKVAFLKVKWLLFPLFIVLLVEVYVYYTYKVKAMDFLMVLIPLCMILFCTVNESKVLTTFQFNATLSLGVYLCHPIAIRFVYKFLPQKSFDYIVIKYFIICVLAVFIWWIVEKINKRFSYFL